MKIQLIPIKDIIIGDRFREDMGDLNVLVQSIKDKGILQPISVDNNKKLLAGGRRIAAALEVGMEKIPAVTHKVEGELGAREIELIENIARKDFTWVERANLERKIFELKKEADPDWTQRKQSELLSESVGSASRRLQLAEIMEIVPELADCKTETEAWKKYQRLQEDIITQSLLEDEDDPRFKEAAQYAKDHYKIGDAIKGLGKMQNMIAGFIEVDPPYGVELPERKSRNQDLAALDNYNEVDAKDYESFIHKVAVECERIMKPNTFMIWWFGPQWYHEVLMTLRATGLKVSDIPGIWVKGISGQTASPDTMLGSSYEPFFVCRKGMPKLRKPGRSNVFSIDPVAPQYKIHPTERPIELMNEIMDTFCYPSQVICIPFLGSGVTLRAAYQAQCVGFGWDLDEMCKTRFVNAVYTDMKKKVKT